MGKDLNFGGEPSPSKYFWVPSTPAKGKRSAISCYFGPLFYYMQFCIEGQKLFFLANQLLNPSRRNRRVLLSRYVGVCFMRRAIEKDKQRLLAV